MSRLFILFLLPVFMVVAHVIFTIKYWERSKKSFKIWSLIAFFPLIIASFKSIQYSFWDSGIGLDDPLFIYLAVWPFYALLAIIWILKYTKPNFKK